MKKNSELTIGQTLRNLWMFNPVAVYINKTLVWDDNNNDPIQTFYWLLELEDIVTFVKLDIVDFHHSIIYLQIN